VNIKPFSRVERVEQELLKIVNQILSKDIDLRKYGFLTFSSIKMTADLKHANIFYSIINPTKEIELINTELNNMVPLFRKHVAAQIRLKFTPTLKFIYDNSFEEFEKINNLINKIN
jgi:ribosome-binding factor A|tara:strand:+ start:987 stop:1334 length:348 start_codon:yes stop_codon:yes gene_type:complete